MNLSFQVQHYPFYTNLTCKASDANVGIIANFVYLWETRL